jgi:hypothetical protein
MNGGIAQGPPEPTCYTVAEIAFDVVFDYFQLFAGEPDPMIATQDDIDTVMNVVD